MAGERWFLKLPGVPGESTHVAHKGEIDVESWSWGARRDDSTSPGGGAGRAGRAAFDDFHFVARISKASPPLFLACATGSHFKDALLSGQHGGSGRQTDFLKYKLTDVSVTSFHQGGTEGDVPVDQFSLSFHKIEVSYAARNAAGKLDKAVEAGFDLASYKKL